MTTKQELITPERADAMLATMETNRILSRRKVEDYKNSMKRGEFNLSLDPICIDEEGHLINGQHRLTAVRESGVSIISYVAYDVPKDMVFDRGLPRSIGPSLYMRGLISRDLSTTNRIALVNAFFKSCGGKFTRLTDDEKAVFLNRFENEIITTDHIQRLGSPKNNGMCRRAGVGAAILGALISGVDENVLSRFADCVNTGFISNDGESAAISLRNWLIETTGMSGASFSETQTSYTEQAISCFAKNKPRHMRFSQTKHVYIKPLVERWLNGKI